MAIMKDSKATMIYLERDTHAAVKRLAASQRVSMAELIRKAVDRYIIETVGEQGVEALPRKRGTRR
jgi:hypothetical protein